MVYKLKLAILVLGIIQIGPLIIVSPLVVWSWTTIATGPALASGTAGWHTPSVCTIVPSRSLLRVSQIEISNRCNRQDRSGQPKEESAQSVM
jgi:hypothetical protein